VTLCRTDKAAGTKGFSMILVETDTQGFEPPQAGEKMGLKGSADADAHL